jgi:competence protein ComEA
MPDRPVALWHRIRSGEDPVAFGAVVVALALAAGLLWFWAGAHGGGAMAASAAPGAPVTETPGHLQAPPADRLPTTTGPAVTVHVAGAVVHAGLYHLPSGSRVADALAAAGGSVPRADLDRLNLAARLVDGQKVLVTRRGEPTPTVPDGAAVGGGVAGYDQSASEPVEPIDLNAAGLPALDSLPGIGPATARAILEERARRGGFRSTRDLLRVPGIGEGRFARLKDRVRV